MKTKTKEGVIGSGGRLLQDFQFPDKNRRNIWNFHGISEFMFCLFHDFSRNLRNARESCEGILHPSLGSFRGGMKGV